jgi:hypothetical protein
MLFGAGPILPELALDRASSDLPACCKKDGAHKCSVRRAHAGNEDKNGTPSVRAVCPFPSSTDRALLNQQSFVPGSVQPDAAVILHSPRLPLTPRSVQIDAASAANPKRGPPELAL